MKIILLIVLGILSMKVSVAADSAEMNDSNSPLAPRLGLLVQNYATRSIYGSDQSSNTLVFREVFPHKVGGLPQLTRFSIPVNTVPDGPDDRVTGLGDMNLFNVFLIKPRKGLDIGLGPYIIFPTANSPQTGTELWQAGLTSIVIDIKHWGFYGGLMTYQHSIAGPDENAKQNLATFQPFYVHNLPKGYYARSTAIWSANLQNGFYYIPIGAGLGKIWRTSDGSLVNISAEPQWTIAHAGDGQPKFQFLITAGIVFALGN